MKASIYHALSILFDFSVVFAIAAWCICIYNAVMMWDVGWLIWSAAITFGAAFNHWLAIGFEDDAAYYATNKQYNKWYN